MENSEMNYTSMPIDKLREVPLKNIIGDDSILVNTTYNLENGILPILATYEGKMKGYYLTTWDKDYKNIISHTPSDEFHILGYMKSHFQRKMDNCCDVLMNPEMASIIQVESPRTMKDLLNSVTELYIYAIVRWNYLAISEGDTNNKNNRNSDKN